MTSGPPVPRDSLRPRSLRSHLGFALRLRCPACGGTPIFIPVRRVRRLDDWFTPNDGCPRCGFAFEREPGYFLLATWAINYSAACAVGLFTFWALDAWADPPVETLLVLTLIPTVLTAILLARVSKALFLAVDVYMDPPPPRTPSEPGEDGP